VRVSALIVKKMEFRLHLFVSPKNKMLEQYFPLMFQMSPKVSNLIASSAMSKTNETRRFGSKDFRSLKVSNIRR
jgi:hypothetical protein